jgi:hypothetical protein
VGRRHGVERQQAERGRAVDQHVVERLIPRQTALPRQHRGNCVPQSVGPRRVTLQIGFEAHQIGIRGNDVQSRHGGGARNIQQSTLAAQHVIGGAAAHVGGNPEPRRGVALRIQIDDEHPLPDRGQCRAEIDGRGRLADAALLVGDG